MTLPMLDPMKGRHFVLSRILLLSSLAMALPACAPRGVMTYKHTEVTGRPYFNEDHSTNTATEMGLMEGSRPTERTIWWNNHAMDHRRVDTSRRYRFELLEGSAIGYRGDKYTSSEVWKVYDGQRLIFDASFCRVHSRTMERTAREETSDAESLPDGFDRAKERSFPNTKFDHPACTGSPQYSTLDWTCPQCSAAETKWVEKHAKDVDRDG